MQWAASKRFAGAAGASVGFLTSEDDGYTNLASQMGCVGSPKRNQWNDPNQYKTFWGVAYGSPKFKCNNANKGTHPYLQYGQCVHRPQRWHCIR